MRTQKNRKGFTLIETLLAIAIFAAIALPLLTVFLQSIKTDQAARNVLNANYIAQDYIETLDSSNYQEAIGSVPNRISKNGYYLSAKIEPYGNSQSLFSAPCDFLHINMQSNGTMLVVLPDGKWRLFASVPATVSVVVSSKNYSFSGGGTTITGTAPMGKCAVLVNATKKAAGVTSGLTMGANCKAVIYCLKNNKNDITLSGDGVKYVDILSPTRSLVHVTASVYEKPSGGMPIATSEAYINIRNESP
jgi:prepilin-type N-terminal cleavage/methylation domain-containing protein